MLQNLNKMKQHVIHNFFLNVNQIKIHKLIAKQK